MRQAADRIRGQATEHLSDREVVEQLWNSFNDIGPYESHVIDNERQDPERTEGTLAERLQLGELALA